MKEKLRKACAYFRGFFLRRKMEIKGRIKSYGRTIVENDGGLIEVGKGSCFWPDVKLSLATVNDKIRPTIKIGNFTSIGDRTQIHAAELVSIGNYVLISWDVNILDFDFHAPGGGQIVPKPITIEDDCWIGIGVIILKGVTIGKGSIIGAGSVVTKDVPPHHFAAGNPAKVIKQVESWRGKQPDKEV